MKPFFALFLILTSFIGILYGSFNDWPFLVGVFFGVLFFQTIYYTVCGSFFNPPTENGALTDHLDQAKEAEKEVQGTRLIRLDRP